MHFENQASMPRILLGINGKIWMPVKSKSGVTRG
jgi:hypothetical protein